MSGAVVGLITALGTSGLHAHSVRGLLLLLAVGGCATAAQLLMTKAYAVGKPLVNASLQYLAIAFAYGYGILVFEDAVSGLGLLGTVLVVGAGLAASRLRQAQPGLQASKGDVEV